jgi:hypothetical protein
MSAILGTAATLRFDGVAGFDCLHGTPRLIQPDNINQTLKIWLNGGHFPFAFSPGRVRLQDIFSRLARLLTATTDRFNFTETR